MSDRQEAIAFAEQELARSMDDSDILQEMDTPEGYIGVVKQDEHAVIIARPYNEGPCVIWIHKDEINCVVDGLIKAQGVLDALAGTAE